MKSVSACPKIVSGVVVLLLLVQLALVQAGKISEKSKKYSNKEIHCVEGKNGNCTKTIRHGADLRLKASASEVEAQVATYNNRRASFTKRFEQAMNFAERIVVDFFREFLTSFYGWERNGLEMGVVEMIVRTVAKDMLFIMQAMH